MTQETSGGPLTASVEKLRQELDRWLDVAWNQGERALDAIGLRDASRWTPRVDIVEAVDHVQVWADVPGVDPASIDLSLAGNMLTIAGERRLPPTTAGETSCLRERFCGRFSRSVPLPASVDAERVSAQTKDGVLHIRVAKVESAKPRKIPVKTMEDTSFNQAQPGPV